MQVRSDFDTSDELLVSCHSHGIKLMKPTIHSRSHSIADLLQLPINIYFLDKNSAMKMINETCATTMGFASITDSFGKTMFDISPTENAENVIKTDRAVVSNNKRELVEDNVIHFDSFNEQHFFTIKMPWYNKNNEIIGIFGASILFGTQPFADSLSKIIQFGLLPQTTPNNLLRGTFHNASYYTKREKECLFYILRGKTARETGKLLNLSTRTIETYINNLKIKLNVSTKSELISKALEIEETQINPFIK
ncbi:MAG: LuxR C-terminal-related transcriptional regulator [Gammaproteobacteria bacterium]